MSNVEITQVEPGPTEGEGLVDYRFESPIAGTTTTVHSIPFEGWIASARQRVIALELFGPGLDRTRVPVGLPRPDVSEAHPELTPMQPVGFRASISTLGLPLRFTFRVSGVLEDSRRIPIAQVHGKRERLQLGESRLRPLVVTCMGRTGSSLVMKLLALHPEIVAYPLWRTEPKVASYWADVMRALADPRSHLQPMTSMISGRNWWLGKERRFDEDFRDPGLREWLGSDQVREIASFCRDRIEAFYDRLIEADQAPAYFAEKCMPQDPSYADVLSEMFPGTREIILVRDFRDTLCSVVAFTEQTNISLFGRQLAGDDESYIRRNFAAQVRLLTRGWRRRSDSAVLLRYEDLILDSRRTLERLLDYLAIDSSDPVLEALLAGFSADDTQTLQGTTASARESIGRWRTDLDPRLVEVCEEVLGPAMDTFGYPRSGLSVT